MNIPMMWMASGAVLGALFWSHIDDALLYSTIWTTATIAGFVFARQGRLRLWVFLVGFGLTGINMPHGHDPNFHQKHVIGSIIERQKYSVLMHTNDGFLRLHVRDPPPVGTQITALVQSTSHPRSLPGAYSRSTIEKRLGIPAGRARLRRCRGRVARAR